MKTFTIEKENKATRETKPEEKRKQEEEKRINAPSGCGVVDQGWN